MDTTVQLWQIFLLSLQGLELLLVSTKRIFFVFQSSNPAAAAFPAAPQADHVTQVISFLYDFITASLKQPTSAEMTEAC